MSDGFCFFANAFWHLLANRIMKTIQLTILACCLVLSSCGNKNATPQDIISSDPNVEKSTVKGVQQLQEFHVNQQVDWLGAIYTYDITRKADLDLPMVTDDAGVQFADNTIELRIMSGGRVFFQKLFTKKAFENYIDADFRKHGILEGLVFDKITPEGLQFAVSVSYPQTDLYMPLLVIVSKTGTITISKDDVLDNSTPAEEEEGV